MVNFGNDELKPHFVYCGQYYQSTVCSEREENFKKMILTEMKKIGIQSLMLTMFYMWRCKLVTEETAKASFILDG